LLLLIAMLPIACRKVEPRNLQKLAPAETLVYLESEDLERTLIAITQSNKFQQLSESADDFSQVRSMQLAIAITGFEAKEEEASDDLSVLSFSPRFVAIFDTHSPDFVNKMLLENKISDFVGSIVENDAQFTVTDENGTKIYSWVAKSGRGIFATSSESVIFFGNDKATMLKSLELKAGNGDSLEMDKTVTEIRDQAYAQKALASGYITQSGVQQIAGLLGLKAAIETSDDANIRTFVSRNLPNIIQKSVRGVSWIANAHGDGIEDAIHISLEPETAKVFSETMTAADQSDEAIRKFIPLDAESFSIYAMKNPQLSFRGLVLLVAQNSDPVSGKIIAEFSRAAFSSYGIADSEEFLSLIEPDAATIRLDSEGDRSAIIATAKTPENFEKLLSKSGFKPIKSTAENFRYWKNNDGFVAALNEKQIVIGEDETVNKCIAAYLDETRRSVIANVSRESENASLFSFTRSAENGAGIIELLGEPLENAQAAESWERSFTFFDKDGFTRKTNSDFGLIGQITGIVGREK